MSRNLTELSGRKGLAHNLFEELGRLAEVTGTPDARELDKLGAAFLVGKAAVHGAVSFYDFLKPQNAGKQVHVCNGSACLTAATQTELVAKLGAHFPEDAIGEACCLGRCHENHAFQFNGHNYSGNDIAAIEAIKAGKSAIADHYHVASIGTPVLTGEPEAPASFYQTFEACLVTEPAVLLAEIRASGLRGRGGAGFPMALKLEACRAALSATKYIVCNADEGDPGAYSDRYLMEQRPHTMLMGMMIAGYITGANHGVVYIRGEYPESVDIVSAAIAVLHEANLVGENIHGSGFSFDFKVIKARGAYICGEETALLSSIEGQRPEVRVRPPYPTQQGLFNKPTVVSNVESLANLPFIIKHGGKAFAAIGTTGTSGTKLMSLDGHFNRPGIYEVEMGTPLRTVLDDLGGGFRQPVKALHIGGPLGGLLPVHEVANLTVDFETFAAAGFLLGHASVVCIPEGFPMISYLEHLFDFVARESCGKCFPCRLGSKRGHEMIAKASHGIRKMDSALMADLLETLETGSLCALGGGLPLPIRNALKHFAGELSPYFHE
ncbi:MAG: NADH-ubiquinone oxidoreductase-F iron-sulfur binding region domain-containing protein [Verrucomicrobiota bacterium]